MIKFKELLYAFGTWITSRKRKLCNILSLAHIFFGILRIDLSAYFMLIVILFTRIELLLYAIYTCLLFKQTKTLALIKPNTKCLFESLLLSYCHKLKCLTNLKPTVPLLSWKRKRESKGVTLSFCLKSITKNPNCYLTNK